MQAARQCARRWNKLPIFLNTGLSVFFSPLGTDRNSYQRIVSQQLISTTQHELENRGLHLVTVAPQLLINFNAALNDKTRVSTMPASTVGMGFSGGYYGYRNGIYTPWPMYRDETVVTQYQEGTLNIDVVDAARKQMVWEAVVTDSVTQHDLDNLPAAIDNAVKAAFVKFPATAAPEAKK